MADEEQRRALAFAEELAAACERLLGDLLVAVMLHGSLAFRDFRPGRSDIDILVVVERPLSGTEIAALQELVTRLGPRAPGGIEWVVAYGDEHLARWQGLTDDEEHGELMVLTTCRI